MLYCCEACGKKFTTEEQALNCERFHAKEKAKQKDERAKQVNSHFKTFYDA